MRGLAAARLWENLVGDIAQTFPEARMQTAGSGYFFFPSSAMYMIWCLKMNRFGAPWRVRRTMFLS